MSQGGKPFPSSFGSDNQSTITDMPDNYNYFTGAAVRSSRSDSKFDSFYIEKEFSNIALSSALSPVNYHQRETHQKRNKSIHRHHKRHYCTPNNTPTGERPVITSEIANFMRCKKRFMPPDFKPIPPSPGGWGQDVTCVIDWEKTTDTFCTYSPYFSVSKKEEQEGFSNSKKSKWKQEAFWINDNETNEEAAVKKRHHHTKSWSPPPQQQHLSAAATSINLLYQQKLSNNIYTSPPSHQHQLQYNHRPRRSTISGGELNNNYYHQHVVNSILKVVDDEPATPPPSINTTTEYYWHQLNTETLFWHNLAMYTKASKILLTNSFFVHLAHKLRQFGHWLQLIAIEELSLDLQGYQPRNFTIKPVFMLHYIDFDYNIIRLSEAGISQEARAILNCYLAAAGV